MPCRSSHPQLAEGISQSPLPHQPAVSHARARCGGLGILPELFVREFVSLRSARLHLPL